MNTYIKRCREEAGLTQAKLAEKMDVSVVAVQNWERGRTKINPDRYMDLAEVFNVPVDKLIKEILIEENKLRTDKWPDFLFDEETNAKVDTLHLNLTQQDLFGLLYIYGAEYLEKTAIDIDTFNEDLKRIPYEFIDRIGSIQFMNQAEGLHKVIKYIQTDFILKVLKQNPEAEFNVRKLSKNLICEFIDEGYKRVDDTAEMDYGYEGEDGIYFPISMRKARIMLPILDKFGPIHLSDGWGERYIRKDVPEEILMGFLSYKHYSRELFDEGYYKKEYNAINLIGGLNIVTDYKRIVFDDKQGRWMWSINDKGRQLLDWFNK